MTYLATLGSYSTWCSKVSTETPSQWVSNLVHLVTQLMSTVGVSWGRASNSCQVQRFGSFTCPSIEKSHRSRGVCGVGPAESTGKPRSRYCPGGSLPLVSLGWRRPRNPREKNPSLIVSPPALLSLCSYCALVYHAQTFSRLRVRGARWTLPLLLFSGRRDLAGCAYHFLSARHRDFVAPP